MPVITPDQSRQARREFGLSQADVAEATGLKRQYLSEFESDTAQRFTSSQLRKLLSFYQQKLEAALAAGEEIDLAFGGEEATHTATQPRPSGVEEVKSKRFFFPVDDEVSDDVLSATLATIRANDKKLADLLGMTAEREETIFGMGDFTENSLQALRDAFSLLAANYLMVRAIGGWPEVGLAASNLNIAGDSIMASLLAECADTFSTAKLATQVQAPDKQDHQDSKEEAVA